MLKSFTMITPLINYIKESIEELKKVSWPTRKETVRLTLIVVIISAVVGAYLGGLDFILNELLKVLIR